MRPLTSDFQSPSFLSTSQTPPDSGLFVITCTKQMMIKTFQQHEPPLLVLTLVLLNYWVVMFLTPALLLHTCLQHRFSETFLAARTELQLLVLIQLYIALKGWISVSWSQATTVSICGHSNYCIVSIVGSEHAQETRHMPVAMGKNWNGPIRNGGKSQNIMYVQETSPQDDDGWWFRQRSSSVAMRKLSLTANVSLHICQHVCTMRTFH